MTILFTASLEGKRHYLDQYQHIIEILEKRGSKVLSDHVMNAEPDEVYTLSEEQRIKNHTKLEKAINESDFIVAESSYHSVSVGYEISMALHKGKPVLILYKNGTRPPTLLNCGISERVVCEEYTDHTVASVIDDFINYVQGMHDTRFTFFITPEIAAYLERVSKQQKKPKSVYLRELIEADMKSA